jgi:uncharacterized protein with ParB-like and HNH nuclease domain
MFNEKPVSSTHEIRTILGSSRLYQIPAHQRDYKWERKEVDQLMKDLYYFDSQNVRGEYYLLGQITLTKVSPTIYQITDGQQRLSTLTILFAIVNKRLSELVAARTGGRGDQSITNNSYVAFTHHTGAFRVDISDNSSTEILGKYLLNKDYEANGDSQLNVKSAISNIESFLKSKEQTDNIYDDEARLFKFSESILDYVCLVEIVIQDPEKAFEFYDRGNTRGRGLTASETLKNSIFQNVTNANRPKINTDWKTAQKNLTVKGKKTTKDRSIDSLLLHLYKARTGSKLSSTQSLYSNWKDLLGTTETNWIGFGGEIKDKSAHLIKIVERSDIFSELSLGTKHLGVVQNYAVRLAGTHLSTSSRELLEKRVEAIAMLWWYAGLRENNYDAMSSKWVMAVAELDKDATVEDIVRSTKIESPDTNSEEELLAKSIAGLEALRYNDTPKARKRCHSVLARVSYEVNNANKMSDMFVTKSKNNPGMDIEHILAKSTVSLKDDLENAIGNLTLLFSGPNTAEGTKSPIDKAETYSSSTKSPTLTKALSKSFVGSYDEKRIGDLRSYVVTDEHGFESIVDLTVESGWDEYKIEARSQQIIGILVSALRKDLGI